MFRVRWIWFFWIGVGWGNLMGCSSLPMALPLNWNPTATTLPSPAFPTMLPPTPTPIPTSTPRPPTPTATPTVTPSATPTPWPWGAATIIGYSVEGRPLEVYRFGDGPVHRLIVAGIHGGYEANTVHLAQALIRNLRLYPEVIPENVTLFILPNLNPDGYNRHHGIYGRANARGVDLNRNFPVHWQPDWERRGCWNYLPISAGTAPFSEPETRALRDFLYRPDVHVDALISYHSAALGIFPGVVFPQGEPHGPSVALAKELARVTGYRYPPLDYGCAFTGQLVDWAATALNIAAVDVELTNHRDINFRPNWNALSLFLRWTYPRGTPAAAP